MHPDLRGGLRAALVCLLLAACGGGENTDVSTKARVMPKSGAVWGRDLANGLGLQEYELCKELGSYDCISDAHLIALGGVEPARLGIDEPLPNAAVSAPIAVDRVASSACGERYARDVAGPAVVFGALLEKDTRKNREGVAELLVQRILARQPTKDETRALLDLYDDIAAVSDAPAKDWAIGACVVVATSTEALFY